MRFTHLHVHSHYSLLDGLSKIPELVQHTKALGMDSLALTDHGVLYGAVEFYQQAKKAGIKPIMGMETYVAPHGRKQKRAKIDDTRWHLILLAVNTIGYKNLLKLSTLAHLEGYYYKPRVDWDLLAELHEGIVALSGCLNGEIADAVRSGQGEAEERAVLERAMRVFGEGNFFLELQHRPTLPDQHKVNERLLHWSKQMGLPIVATNDSHYLNADDADAQDVLLCLQTKAKKEEKNRLSMLGEDLSLAAPSIMAEWFKDYPEAISNTALLADRVEWELELGKIILPGFAVPEQKTAESYLRELSEAGLKSRFGDAPVASTVERLNYELDVISRTGFASYFLIVADLVRWARSQGIVVGPGRGSAAGSLVSYCLLITNVDPIRYELYFERFLNVDRISMPDIDLDFADTRRNEVIHYVEEKYGKDHVAQIITFGTMAARAAIRDCGRVLGISYSYCDRLAKMIPMFTDLDEALKNIADVKELYESQPDARTVFDAARKVEHVARHASTHACGVVIADRPLVDYLPLQYASSDDATIISQYSLHPVEDLGLLKIDFLGLKNLTIIEQTVKLVSTRHGTTINIDDLPMDDGDAFALLQRGETIGIFQLESQGMTRYLKELVPTELEDLIAMVSLYRPGPMELLPDYIGRKHGRKRVEYIHPKLKSITEKTYGVMVYQEQLMQMARDLAGFTLSEADTLRKAVGKKIKRLLDEQREKLVSGMEKNRIARSTAEKIWTWVEPFARYAFNRSHAACYATIAYQTAWLKAHYAQEFMTALLTADEGDMDRVASLVTECRRMGLSVLSPDINESEAHFSVARPTVIRFGLAAIKQVGQGLVDAVIAERTAHGPFASMENFLERTTHKDLNKKSLESLVQAGAFDQFADRAVLLANVSNLLDFAKGSARSFDSQQASLFSGGINRTLQLSEPATPGFNPGRAEREFLGLYLSDHPFRPFAARFGELLTSTRDLEHGVGEGVVAAGLLRGIKRILTKKGDPMLFARLEDLDGSVEVVVFPKTYAERPSAWEDDTIVVLWATVGQKEGVVNLIAERMELLTDETVPSIVEYLEHAERSGGQLPTARPRRHNDFVVERKEGMLFDEWS